MDWLYKIKENSVSFLRKMSGGKRPGFFHYSLSGDYWPESLKWGLSNAVFFLKIVYTLGLEKEFAGEVKEAIDFVKSFQKKNGEISDSFLHLASLPFLLRSAWKEKKMPDLSLEQVRRAETRQAFCALGLFGARPKFEYQEIPKTREEIDRYLNALDWGTPWGAGSHFSHLLFFLSYSSLKDKKDLIEYSIDWINRLQNEDGFWYKGNSDEAQKINGAMKIITGFKVAGRVSFQKAEPMIDLCLAAKNDRHACDNFNITYVLKYCFEQTGGKYRSADIKNFMIDRLSIYREYYHQDVGGFSFKKNKANRFYYGALVSRGKNEPDIHGTVMFLWGISVIAQVLGVEKELGFKEFIT